MIVEAPWSEEQVENLKEFQVSGKMHPFTCPQHDGMGEVKLTPTVNGWVCSDPRCDYEQNWAHDFMLDGVYRRTVGGIESSLLLG